MALYDRYVSREVMEKRRESKMEGLWALCLPVAAHDMVRLLLILLDKRESWTCVNFNKETIINE